jgi:hypothetical protein
VIRNKSVVAGFGAFFEPMGEAPASIAAAVA